MKIRIDSDELYPYYFETEGLGFDLELTDEEYALVTAAEEAFGEAQNLIARKLEEQGGIVGGIIRW